MRHASRIVPLCLAAILCFAAASAGDPQCDRDKASLAKLDKSISALESAGTAGKMASDLIDIIDVLSKGLKATKGDLGKITGPVKDAQAKLKDLTENLGAGKNVLPPGMGALKGALDKFSKQIDAGVKKYKASAPGKVAGGLSDAQGYIATVTGQLDAIRSGLEQFKAFDEGANGSGADQIRAMKTAFDAIRKATGAGEVPGVGQFLDAYSTAIGGIADNVGKIEATLHDRLKMANEALEGTDFGNLDNLYPGLQTDKQKKDAALAALRQERADIAARIHANGCDAPPPKADPCKGKPQTAKNMTDKRTAKQQAELTSAEQAADAALNALFNHGWTKPKPPLPSTAQTDLAAARALLAQLKTISSSGYATVFDTQSGHDMMAALGGKPDTGYIKIGEGGSSGNRVDEVRGNIIPSLSRLIDGRQKAADAETAAAKSHYDADLRAWTAENAKLVASAKRALADRSKAKEALDKATGDSLAQEAAYSNWSDADQKLFDECFPHEGKLRQKSQPRFPISASNSGNGPDKHCSRGGGLAGAMENVACQIQNGH